MKKNYEKPEVEYVTFDVQDIITGDGFVDGNPSDVANPFILDEE